VAFVSLFRGHAAYDEREWRRGHSFDGRIGIHSFADDQAIWNREMAYADSAVMKHRVRRSKLPDCMLGIRHHDRRVTQHSALERGDSPRGLDTVEEQCQA
jgi:hypothetical protein